MQQMDKEQEQEQDDETQPTKKRKRETTQMTVSKSRRKITEFFKPSHQMHSGSRPYRHRPHIPLWEAAAIGESQGRRSDTSRSIATVASLIQIILI
jgi:hypothetical protein